MTTEVSTTKRTDISAFPSSIMSRMEKSVEPAPASELLQLFDDLPYGFRLRKVGGL